MGITSFHRYYEPLLLLLPLVFHRLPGIPGCTVFRFDYRSSVFALNAIPVLLFSYSSLSVNCMAYDDQYYLADAHRYDNEWGVGPASPTGFVWMALAACMFPADELQSGRAAMLISWLLLGVGILLGSTRQTTRTPEKTAFYR